MPPPGPGNRPPRTRHPPPRRLLLRTVRTLLECILVLSEDNIFSHWTHLFVRHQRYIWTHLFVTQQRSSLFCLNTISSPIVLLNHLVLRPRYSRTYYVSIIHTCSTCNSVSCCVQLSIFMSVFCTTPSTSIMDSLLTLK